MDSQELLALIREDIKGLKRSLEELRWLVECELYGRNGRQGLKQQVNVLWEERKRNFRTQLVVWGALLSALASLAVTLFKAVLVR